VTSVTRLKAKMRNGTCGLREGWQFAFCGIEKVGITLWTQIFCRINYGVKETVHPVTGAVLRSCALNFTQNWQSHSRGYMSREYHWTNSLHRDVIFGNPEWFVATVVRDPLERLLSGYLDKCVTRKKREFERHCEPRVRRSPSPSPPPCSHAGPQLGTSMRAHPTSWLFVLYSDSLHASELKSRRRL
jgi:hypothetical protein